MLASTRGRMQAPAPTDKCGYLRLFDIKRGKLATAAFVATAEHLVELQTDALDGGEQRFEADDHEVAQDDHQHIVDMYGFI